MLDYLALAEPLRRSDVSALAGQDATDEAESLGAIVVDGDAMVYPAHPLYTGRARAALTPDAERTLRTSLVEHLTSQPSGHVGDRLRLVALSVGSDSPAAVADTVAAAQQALRLGELALAERLATDRWTARADCLRGWRWPTRWPGRAVDAKPTRRWRRWTPRDCHRTS